MNVGCIPSKALLHSSHEYEKAQHHLQEYGIDVEGVTLNLAQMMKRKDKVVEDLTKGINFLFKKNGITSGVGSATIVAPGVVHVKKTSGEEEAFKARHILIATGSVPSSLPHIEIDEERIVSSTGALSLKQVPSHMIVVGGGYIGLEMGSVWQRLGAKVTVVEFLDQILPSMDTDVRQTFLRSLQKQGLNFKLSTKVVGVKKDKKDLRVTVESHDKKEEMACDVLLIATGRKPFTEGLGLEKLGISVDEKGFIPVNENYETEIPGIYAVGDVIQGPMLAHKASEEAIAAIEIMAGQKGHVNYRTIPAVIYTHPEVASVGLTEEDIQHKGIPYAVGKFPFTANSRAKTNGDTEGFVKILSHGETDAILGVHIVGADAGTLIGEAILGMEFGAAAEDIARTCHAHPTTSEALKEAALAANGGAIHL